MSNAVLTRHTPTITTLDKILLGVSLVVGIGFVTGFVFPYLQTNSASLNQYLGKQGWLLTHITMGTVALVLGPFALGLGLSRKRMRLHRALGTAYMAAIVFGSIAAFYLASHTDVSWVFGMGLTGLGIAWLTTTGLAFVAIKKRLIAQHQEWMIRSYVVTFGFVFFRIMVGILQVANVGTLIERLNVASWFCWSFPLLITELCLQGKKVLGAGAKRANENI